MKIKKVYLVLAILAIFNNIYSQNKGHWQFNGSLGLQSIVEIGEITDIYFYNFRAGTEYGIIDNLGIGLDIVSNSYIRNGVDVKNLSISIPWVDDYRYFSAVSYNSLGSDFSINYYPMIKSHHVVKFGIALAVVFENTMLLKGDSFDGDSYNFSNYKEINLGNRILLQYKYMLTRRFGLTLDGRFSSRLREGGGVLGANRYSINFGISTIL